MPPLIVAGGHAIKTASLADLQFVEDLQRKHSNAIGFIPRQATEWYLEAGRVQLALENDEPAGMLLGREKLRWNIALRPITQAAIDFSAQRRHHGLGLVERIALDAKEAGQLAIQACCREGLEANDFWRAADFEEICRLDPSNARGKHIIVWRRKVQPNFTPAWFYIPPPVAGYRARKAKVVR